MKAIRRWAGITAAGLILLFGIPGLLYAGPGRIIGACFVLVGGVALALQIRAFRASREDPYDLRRLYDVPTNDDQPEDEDLVEDGVPYCYHCGHAVTSPFARCPECGNQVR